MRDEKIDLKGNFIYDLNKYLEHVGNFKPSQPAFGYPLMTYSETSEESAYDHNK